MEEKLNEEIDLSHVNEIDMECNIDPDEEDGFGGFVSREPSTHVRESNKQEFTFDNFKPDLQAHGAANDDREIKRTIGVSMDFSDDYPEMNNFKDESFTDKVEEKDQVVDLGEVPLDMDFSGVNEIDMECSVGEDDDDFSFGGKVSIEERKVLDFDDPEEDKLLNEKALIDEEIVKKSITERKSEIDQGKVEKDYWKRLQKKHKKTNVKGAYNTHFHFSGNPEQEMDDFNHDMTPKGPIPNATNVQVSGEGDMLGGECIGGMGESKETNNYRKLFEDLLLITGFELGDCKDNKCVLKDLYSDSCKECETINDVENFLYPYVQDCFILPLQVSTNQKFDNCDDWVKWYGQEGVKDQYPQCEKDIKYCDLWANHLPECKLF